ncbi:pseudouridine synthase [Arsukibacterium sp. MJ3]|jgi:pseudouridine synthase|uniref:23S rRNA pseudouridine(2604) synthase RluF n=1 Tax=Arsukibacterium sp. MJ3 TaxID=1632859 RepID=UPI000626F52B|nr:23S rRNA pseudouridine(2604) synthase RluF [Arsukibacterium sp. MJ3]KKO50577.1 pseudouridine synthase [Arsukibacterium sp. MJ3]
MTSTTQYRLNKYISDTGFCSRRQADKFIEQGVVTVNGQLATVGLKVTINDQVQVDGKPLKEKPARVYLAYHKPVGITCTTERHIKGNIIDAIGYSERIFPIGRLDKPSEGLIFLTNDGDIVNKVLRAGNAHEKEYTVSVNKPISSHFIAKMSSGVPILDTVTLPCKVSQISKNTFKIILTQGLNRQIRRMAEYLGYEVVKLKRIRIMHVRLAELRAGQWRLLDKYEMAHMEQLIEHSAKTATVDNTLARHHDEE